MSWVILNKQTSEVVCEILTRNNLAGLNVDKYDAVPIKEYLEQLNLSLNDGLTYADKLERGLIK